MTDIMTESQPEPAAPAGGFSAAISRILSHTGVPRPKRIKRVKVEDVETKPAVTADSAVAPDAAVGNDGDIVEIEPKIQKSAGRSKHLTRQERDPWHVLPDVTEREKERKLTKIATKYEYGKSGSLPLFVVYRSPGYVRFVSERGVVQLFNAVRVQQSSLEEKLEEAGPSFRKSEQALKSVSKGDFLDLLKNPSGSVKIRRTEKSSDAFGETEEPKRWEVLDDGYMTRKTAGGESSGEDEGNADGYDAASDSDASLEEIF